jgi:hypothetical protein
MSLDDDLAAWAADVRLRDAEAAVIFRRIVSTPVTSTPAPRLDPTWWRGFNAGFTARMVASTRPARRVAA